MNTEPLSRIADGELQARIDRFARLMLDADERYLRRPHAIDDRAERDRCWLELRHLRHERARRRRMVERMEQGREVA